MKSLGELDMPNQMFVIQINHEDEEWNNEKCCPVLDLLNPQGPLIPWSKIKSIVLELES